LSAAAARVRDGSRRPVNLLHQRVDLVTAPDDFELRLLRIGEKSLSFMVAMKARRKASARSPGTPGGAR